MTDPRALAGDLRAEQEALDEVVADLADEQWHLPTPSPGWTVADQIGHLTYFDGTAATAVTDPDAFRASIEQLLTAEGGVDALTLHRDLSASDLLEAWRANRARLHEAAAGLEEGIRVPWYGPSMSAKSFLTARLMECWAHGQDVADAAGVERTASDRLRHVAQIGFITRGWTYANRGGEAPSTTVRLELAAPSGDTWRFGPDDADEVVTGPAADFCLVVTQRRHVDDTSLEVAGPASRDWLEKAQAFAGPPTVGPLRSRR